MQTGMATTERNKKIWWHFSAMRCFARVIRRLQFMILSMRMLRMVWKNDSSRYGNATDRCCNAVAYESGVWTLIVMFCPAKGMHVFVKSNRRWTMDTVSIAGLIPAMEFIRGRPTKPWIYAIQEKKNGISVENSAPSFGQTTFSLFSDASVYRWQQRDRKKWG